MENLSRQDFEVYLPLIEILKRRAGEITARVEPFFPRYLFIKLDKTSDNWAPIRSTRGVSGLVKFQGVPKAVPDLLIESLRANEDSRQLQNLQRQKWQAGDNVEIESGPFAGYSCIFEESRGEGRVSVLMDIIGKETRATLQYADLQLPKFA